jgi:hypothetical protein
MSKRKSVFWSTAVFVFTFIFAGLMFGQAAKASVANGKYETNQETIVCTLFSGWLDMLGAIKSGDHDLVVHYMTNDEAVCTAVPKGVELTIVDSSDRWVEGMFKLDTGRYIKVYTHPVFVTAK